MQGVSFCHWAEKGLSGMWVFIQSKQSKLVPGTGSCAGMAAAAGTAGPLSGWALRAAAPQTTEQRGAASGPAHAGP